MSGQDSSLVYRKIFDPARAERHELGDNRSIADRSSASTYVFDESIVLAINVALAAGRPLLIRGPSGCGKSSIAGAVSYCLNWSYAEIVVTSRTQARDLLWQTDQLRRLQDAQLGQLNENYGQYITPGPLFWAFSPLQAQFLLTSTGRTALIPVGQRETRAGCVVLIDEIDKGDPDVPNNLLEPLGKLKFTIDDLNLAVSAENPPLVVLTTNEERDLPPAFLRRCIELLIAPPKQEQLVRIGVAHFPSVSGVLIRGVAEHILASAEKESPPSAAEFLDMIRACLALGVEAGTPAFSQIAAATLWKHERRAADDREDFHDGLHP